MAILAKIDTDIGVFFDSAYGRIAQFSGTKSEISVIIAFHASEEARRAEAREVKTIQLTLPLREGATMQQMYEQIKTLPGFCDAADV